MGSEFGESTTMPSQSQSYSGNNSNDAGDFECNICFDLARDPIVTLCGHLYCWPCLYRWLGHHSQSHECPVCKALVQEDKLVPLYGRGKTQSDPRSKSYPGIDIPNRPAGQRPETAPHPPEPNPFSNGFGFMSGFAPPVTTANVGNFTMSAAVGGLFPSIFNLQINRFPSTTLYGTTSSFHHGFGHTYYRGHPHGFTQPISQRRQADNLKNLFLLIGFLVLLALIWL